MPVNYPASLDSFTDPAGSDLVAVVDHAEQHNNHNSAIEAIETVLGTTPASSLFNSFAASDKPLPHQGGTVQIAFSGTINDATLGTPTVTGGVFNSVTLGSPTISTILQNAGTVMVFQSNNGTADTNYIKVFPGTTGVTMTVIGDEDSVFRFDHSGTAGYYAFQRMVAPQVLSVSDSPGGTITINATSAQIYTISLGTTAGNRTIAAPNNPQSGQLIMLRVKQNSGGDGTIVWDSVFTNSSDVGTPTLGTASTWNYFGWRYNEVDSQWDYQGQVQNII